MNKFNIRQAGIKDIKSIKEIELAASTRFKGLGLVDNLLDHHFDQTLLKTLIAEKQVWLAQLEMEVKAARGAAVETAVENEPLLQQPLPCKAIGFAIAAVLRNLAYLEELDVLPAYGRQGVGRSLVTTVADWARQERFRHLTLSTFSHVPWNAPFYQKLGFEILPKAKWEAELHEIHILEDKIGLPLEHRVFMRLKL